MANTMGSLKYIEKIKPVLRKNKFSQLKMDDIAKHMDISKVTLYKHFSSRDDIIQMVVGHYSDYLLEADAAVQDDTIPFAERFLKIYETSLKCVVYVSDLFLQDLKESYPSLWENLLTAQQKRNQALQSFFEEGMARGVFNKMNAAIFMVQDDATLRQIMDPSFAIQYDLTLKQALMDYYQLKKYQLFKPEHLIAADDSAAEKEIVQILQTLK
ncbi:TetR/AcrR family transcriptional regulator [Cohnella nanjingensis]|uniref:TetR/AcrR family transcriptional regulator n=1 Tax=Cohnella nanjingensis TaxID=1387779 RepID=A0A7X0RQJ8_9BACL|nr:TetR/AcrR family transcriptional regulator [Cohnella nanjingensis]MBB6670444.1 TetR/AcrR family transcriptional regulator [Cohnella nanjingensis]